MIIRDIAQRWISRLATVWGSGLAGKLLLLALVLLGPGLLTPVMTLDTLGSTPASFSILEGAWRLLGAGKITLGLVIFGFSVIFPLVKLGLLLRYCLIRTVPFDRRWLLWLGKWSMLDLFVVAVIIGAGRLRLLSSFEAEAGIYWFGAAIALSMVGAELLLHVPGQVARVVRPPSLWRRLWCVVPLSAVGLVIAGLSLPLIEVSKWVFWNNAYSLLSAMPRMWAEGEWLLPVVLLVTVMIAPLVRLVCSGGFHLTRSGRLLELTTAAGQWSMLNVFVLSLLLVMLKLGDAASVDAQPGIWLLTAGAVLTSIDAWLLNRQQAAPPTASRGASGQAD